MTIMHAMENYGEFKHDHVSLYLICVTMHYSPGVLEWTIYHGKPKMKHGISTPGCIIHSVLFI